jgi:hypothetical protein
LSKGDSLLLRNAPRFLAADRYLQPFPNSVQT